MYGVQQWEILKRAKLLTSVRSSHLGQSHEKTSRKTPKISD